MKIRSGIFVLAVAAFSLPGWAQDTNGLPEGYIALLRSDIQTKKTEIIRQNLTLTDEQAKGFWPLQRSYESDLSKLSDERVNVIRDYAKHWDSLADATAKDLGDRLLGFQKKRVDLERSISIGCRRRSRPQSLPSSFRWKSSWKICSI